jgi:hypothetical protein
LLSEDLPEIQWAKPRQKREGGEEGLWKTKWTPKNEENQANREGGIMKNEMPSQLLDEKICFIRLPPDTLQNSW